MKWISNHKTYSKFRVAFMDYVVSHDALKSQFDVGFSTGLERLRGIVSECYAIPEELRVPYSKVLQWALYGAWFQVVGSGDWGKIEEVTEVLQAVTHAQKRATPKRR